MFLQFFTVRQFQVDSKKINKIIRGANKDSKRGLVLIGNKNVVDMDNAEAKKMLTRYPKECEPWGEDAVAKAAPIKARNAKRKLPHPRNPDIA